MHLTNPSAIGQIGSEMSLGLGSSGAAPGMLLGGLPSNLAGDGMLGAVQTMMMTMMSSMMAMMSSGTLGQVMDPGQGAAMVSNQNPSFGSGGTSGSGGGGNGAQSFLGRASAASRGANGSGGGGGASSGAGGADEIGSATGKIVSRPGGQMDASIVKNFDSMVGAAKKDGVSLQISSGYRSRAEQEKLYAAYKNGSGNLAAKPGTSNHEKGQAIDFKNTSGAYSWLAKNAERFGFKNLPGEPWHYSTNGR